VVEIVVVLAVVFEKPASEEVREEPHTPTDLCDTKAFDECDSRSDKVAAVIVSRMSPMVMNEEKSGLFFSNK
jgi:hypothetical protein